MEGQIERRRRALRRRSRHVRVHETGNRLETETPSNGAEWRFFLCLRVLSDGARPTLLWRDPHPV